MATAWRKWYSARVGMAAMEVAYRETTADLEWWALHVKDHPVIESVRNALRLGDIRGTREYEAMGCWLKLRGAEL
jgi:hypothetical protein